MQPAEQRIVPAEEPEAIRYYQLEGLLPPNHVCAFNLALGTLMRLSQDEGEAHPLVLAEQQVTERERFFSSRKDDRCSINVCEEPLC